MCQQIGRCDVVSGEAIGGARCNGDEDGRSEVVGDDVEHLVAAKAAQGVVRCGRQGFFESSFFFIFILDSTRFSFSHRYFS